MEEINLGPFMAKNTTLLEFLTFTETQEGYPNFSGMNFKIPPIPDRLKLLLEARIKNSDSWATQSPIESSRVGQFVPSL